MCKLNHTDAQPVWKIKKQASTRPYKQEDQLLKRVSMTNYVSLRAGFSIAD